MNSYLKDIFQYLQDRFKDLKFFDDLHVYLVNGVKYPSVSKLIYGFYEPFDSKKQAKEYCEKYSFAFDDVILSWEGEGNIASTKGTRVHNFGEDYVKWRYFNIGEKPKPSCKQCLGIIQFWNDLPKHIVPVAVELRMYSKEYKYCGTTDILLYDTLLDSFIIADYKTNKKIFDERNSWSKHLLHIDRKHDLIQDNFGKYSLQFSFYQIPLEEIGLKISSRMLIWLNGSGDKLYSTYRTKDLTNDLRTYLKESNHGAIYEFG